MEMNTVKHECSYCNKPFKSDEEGKKVKERYGERYLTGRYHRDCGERVLDGIDATIAMAGA